ncbi:ANTAR domain-containing protein [Nocardioides alpinus]|uniref:ANTAR domain-containing protein n=1 Tax=Nocardioides alpinus TaxID=748909 RepID=A0A1I0ZEL1_9ACTN|nr:ANTAR domain-containing protein [Nocardioides alpinus]PKH40641.1 hypothetical protein CXG46_11650 [Nocardioides alpinus]SFB23961.1 ANTAR domain-containing protein [Nocardioides alpinus]
MEFIPETLEAIGELDAALDDGSLSDQLTHLAARAQTITPDLAGISVASHVHGLTFTLVATDAEIAALDAVQYLDTGPCEAAIHLGHGIATSDGGLFSEERWQALAVVGAAAGVSSTLTFPIRNAGEISGTVNLYGRSEGTFVGKHQALADVLRAWAPGAVTNADLAFTTRDDARDAPGRLRNDTSVEVATGILAARRGTSLDDARGALDDAARRAGIHVTKVARVVIDLHNQGR